MAKKISIVGNSIIVFDTINSNIDIDEVSKDVYYDSSYLDRGIIKLTQVDGSKNLELSLATIDLSVAIDSTNVPFTSSSFRDFMRFNCGGVGGVVDVSMQNHHTQIIDLKLSRALDSFVLLSNYNINDRVIQIETTGVVPTTSMTVCLKEGLAFYQSTSVTVTPLSGNQFELELDTPLDFAFTTVGGCSLTDTNLAVDGSVTPVIFSISPRGQTEGTSWDLTRVLFLFTGLGIGAQKDKPDDGDFGVTSALEKGIVLRSVNGVTKNIFNAKTNGDFRARAYDVAYPDASRSGVYSVGVRRSFSGDDKNGVTIRLDADTLDTFEVIIQDDLTEMIGGQCVVQGHVVD